MEASKKASELVNMYYTHAKTQAEAIQMVDKVLLTTMCQIVDGLNSHTNIQRDWDFDVVKSQIKILKWWQEVAAEVQHLEMKLPI